MTRLLEIYLMHPWDCRDESVVTPCWPRYHCVHCCGAACLYHPAHLQDSSASQVTGNVHVPHTPCTEAVCHAVLCNWCRPQAMIMLVVCFADSSQKVHLSWSFGHAKVNNSIDAWIWHRSMTNVSTGSKAKQRLPSSKNEGKQSVQQQCRLTKISSV